ncbi:MAG: hypothetical protein PVF74_01645 [Anaerolineales bacterium]
MSDISTRVSVLVGTRKGGFIFTSDSQRKLWQASEILFKSWSVMHMCLDQRDQRMHAAVVHDVYGPSTHYSDDFGKSWAQAQEVPTFSRASRSGRPLGTPDEAREAASMAQETDIAPEEVNKIWHIKPGREEEPGVLYAGIEPAALFKSIDRGETWAINEGLYDHPHRHKWYPGAGGLGLHTIILDPVDQQHMYVAISTGGCYRSDDGGETWQPRNQNVRADFLPEKFPEYGQCVHKITMHPNQPNVLYQQNHCGIYRSDNGGDEWIDIGEGKLPSRFGFPIAVHPHEPQTIYIALEESDDYRVSIDGRFAIWRSKDGGESWERLTKGLPEKAYLVVLREAMAVDNLEEAGIYVGTSTGHLFYSRDNGNTWGILADFLPPILSVETAVIAG